MKVESRESDINNTLNDGAAMTDGMQPFPESDLAVEAAADS
jgi:hypothetical protein